MAHNARMNCLVMSPVLLLAVVAALPPANASAETPAPVLTLVDADASHSLTGTIPREPTNAAASQEVPGPND